MHVMILGSGTNVHPKRAAAGYVVETDQLLLFDFGPRTLKNFQKLGIDRHRLQHLFFSHYHADHFSDFITFFFDAVFHAKSVAPRPPLHIYGPRGTRRLFGAMLKEFPSFGSAPFQVTLTEFTDDTIRLGETAITAGTVVHSEHIHCQGYRVVHQSAVFTYSGDAEYCDAVVRLSEGADVAMLDCSFPVQRPGKGHMTAGDCGRVAREAAVKRLFLTHFYPIAERYDVVAQARREFNRRVSMARDGMRITIRPPDHQPCKVRSRPEAGAGRSSRPSPAVRGSR